MKGLIFFLFLLAHATIVLAAPTKVMDLVVDTLDNEIIEIDPEINEEEYCFASAFLIIWRYNATKLYTRFKITLS